MAKEVTLVNKYTGDIKTINTGWSWSIFLFSPLFGIPLIARELYMSAGTMIILWFINMSMMMIIHSFGIVPFILTILKITLPITLGIQLFLAIKGNQMSINEHMQNGWEIHEQEE